MEIGHNVLHGQWDWMRDPKIHSTTWDWDHASPPEQWKRAHNEQHHTYTNILGKDNDLGYGIMRVDEDQPWQPRYLVQPLWNFVNACIFEYGIAMYDLELGEHLREKRGHHPGAEGRASRQALRKVRKQVAKDYVVHPALSGPSWRRTLAANADRQPGPQRVEPLGDHVRPLPRGRRDLRAGGARRATRPRASGTCARCSARPTSPAARLLHLMSGNLSHQIEHHLFPDLPSNRYAEIAPQVRDLFQRYGLSYHAAPMPKQVASAWHKVLRLSLPNGWLAETTPRNAPRQIAKLFRMSVSAPPRPRGRCRPPERCRRPAKLPGWSWSRLGWSCASTGGTDFEAVHRFASDPEAVTFVTWGPNTEDETRGFIEGWLAERAAVPRTGYTLAMTESSAAGPSARWASTGTGRTTPSWGSRSVVTAGVRGTPPRPPGRSSSSGSPTWGCAGSGRPADPRTWGPAASWRRSG